MKLENIELTFDNFSREMEKLYKEKHFDYLVTIVGEDFGEEGLGCIYILENTQSHARCSTKVIAKQIGEDYVIPSVLPTCWSERSMTSSASSFSATPTCAASSCATTSRDGRSARTST